MALVHNVSDSRQVREGRKKHRTQRRQWQSDLKELMQIPAFQRFAREVLAWGHPYATSFDADALVMAFKEGERNLALRLVDELNRADPTRFHELILLPGARERAAAIPEPEPEPDAEG